LENELQSLLDVLKVQESNQKLNETVIHNLNEIIEDCNKAIFQANYVMKTFRKQAVPFNCESSLLYNGAHALNSSCTLSKTKRLKEAYEEGSSKSVITVLPYSSNFQVDVFCQKVENGLRPSELKLCVKIFVDHLNTTVEMKYWSIGRNPLILFLIFTIVIHKNSS
jgi:hypothetical protein